VAGDDRRSRSGDYRTIRHVAALVFTGLIVFVVLVDVLDPAYEAASVMLTILGALVLALVGLEAADILRRRP
jgi:peptidoglycan/LPS O-acetylase OafA/YrhL